MFPGSEATRLAEKLGVQWSSSNTSLVEFLLDWVNPFKGSSYTVGVLGVRFADIGNRHRGKSRFIKPLIIIPGPRKPKLLQPYIMRTLLRLKELYEVEDKVILVTERYTDDDGILHERSLPLKVFLAALLADSPACKDSMNWIGVGAKLPCNTCQFESTACPNPAGVGTTRYPLGYVAPIHQSK